MNPLIQLKTTILPLLIALGFACFGLSPTARGQLPSPAPDGGYPNGNTAEGDFALQSLTTGEFNTALGIGALFSNTQGSENTATGAAALLSNDLGSRNTANGFVALFSNTKSDNTAVGWAALASSTAGGNTAVGSQALLSNTIGTFNVASGYQALGSNTEGSSNSANGYQALFHNTKGDSNTANGDGALFSNTEGFDNTAVGFQALLSNTSGNHNTAVGSHSLFTSTSDLARDNTAAGYQALFSNTTGDANTASGVDALFLNNTDFLNTAIGVEALGNNTSGNHNIGLGFGAGTGISNADHVICIGVNGANVSNSCFIGNISGVNEGGTISAVYINTNGRLGTQAPPSSRRFKKEIKPMDQTSEAILGLKPVTFHYKSDTTGTPQFGLIAEEVAKVNPDLVVRDENSEIYSVRYDAVNAMLLNEFLKQHRKVEEQEVTIAQLKQDFQFKLAKQQNQIKALASGLEKVSAQLELRKAAPQMANNDP